MGGKRIGRPRKYDIPDHIRANPAAYQQARLRIIGGTTEARKAQMREYARARYASRRGPAAPARAPGIPIQTYIKAKKIQAGRCAWCARLCEEWNVMMFAWDHIDPAFKEHALSQMKGIANPGKCAIVDAEIAKCQLMCHCCHAYKTWHENDYRGIYKVKISHHPTLFDASP